MRNNGLIIGNAIQSGLSTYGQLQNIDANKQAMGLREADAQMRREQHTAQQEAYKQQQEMNNLRMRQVSEEQQQRMTGLLAKKLFALDSGGDLSPEEQQEYLSITGNARLLDPGYVGSKDFGNALNIYEKARTGQIDKNSDEAKWAANTIFNVQRGATDNRRVSINGIYPSKNGQGVHFGLNVVNADGTVNPNGVLTDNRSADPRDPVSTITFDEMDQVYGAAKNLHALINNPKLRQVLYREYGLVGQPISAKDQSTIDYNNARTKYYSDKAANERKGSGSGGGGNLPAKAQMIQFYESRGYSSEDAIDMANDAVSSPEKFVASYAKILMETYTDPETGEKIKPDEAIDMALDIYGKKFRRRPAKNENVHAGQQQKKPLDVVMEMAGQKTQSVQPPLRAPIPQKTAPDAAIQRLKSDLAAGDKTALQEFREYYGYTPEGL